MRTITLAIAYAGFCAACAGAADIRVAGIHSVGIKVGDAARAERFYSEVLGLGRAGRAQFRVNGTQAVELVPGRTVPADHHLAWIALAVADIGAARTALERSGVPVGGMVKWADGSMRCTLHDPDGNRVDLVQLRQSVQNGDAADARRLSARLRHAGLAVSDLDAAAKFYSEKLGLAVEDLRHGKTRWINMQLPGGDFIQMQTAPPDAAAARRIVFEHFGMDVQDAHATYAELLRRGVPPRAAFEPVVGYAGHLKINFQDPEDMLVEFMELGAPGAHERREP